MVEVPNAGEEGVFVDTKSGEVAGSDPPRGR
jgi:hypothetical protein